MLNKKKRKKKYIYIRDFLNGPVVGSLPCSAGDVGSFPGHGVKILNTEEQQSPCATTGGTVQPQGSHMLRLGPNTAK